MNNISLLTILALAAALTACQQTLDPRETPGVEPGGTHKVVLQARLAEPGGTKVDIAGSIFGTNFTWSAGDEIAVHSTDGNYHVLTLVGGAGTANATFEGELNGDQDYYAVYPASIRMNGYFGAVDLRLALPSSYTISGSMDTDSPLPMIAVNSGGTLSFKYVCGMYRLTLDDVPAGTNKITVTFDNAVSGTFSVNNPGSNAPYIATGVFPSTMTFNLSTPLAAETDGFVLNVPVPTGTYAGDIKVVATGGTKLTARIPNSRTISRGTGRRISKELNAPFGGPFTYGGKEYYISQGNMYKTSTGYALYSDWAGGLDQWGDNNRTPMPDQAATGNGYFDWLHLVGLFDTRTGADAPSQSNNYDINNGKTPISGCKLPTEDQWVAFSTGTDRPGSSVNGTAGCRYAIIMLTGYPIAGSSNPVGVLLIPDGQTITGMPRTFIWNSTFAYGALATSENANVTVEQIEKYIEEGCVFVPAPGSSGGSYWTNGGDLWTASDYGGYDATIWGVTNQAVSTYHRNKSTYYYLPVRLIKEE